MHTYSLPFLVCLCLATQLATAQSTSAQPFCAVEPQAVQLLDFTQNTLAVTSAGAEVQHNQGYHIKFTETEGHVIWSAPKGGWHWSEYVGIGIDLKNESDRTIRLVGQLEDRPNSGSFILLPPQTEDRLVLYLRRKGLPEDSSFADMRGIPGGHMAHWSIPDSNRIRSFQLHDIDGCGLNATITVKAIYGLGKHGVLSHPGSDSFFPFINAYGQYKHGNWPGKIHSDSDLQTAATTEQSDLTTHPGPDDRSQYGSTGLDSKPLGIFAQRSIRANGGSSIRKATCSGHMASPESVAVRSPHSRVASTTLKRSPRPTFNPAIQWISIRPTSQKNTATIG
jgi:hypothetical protein